MEAVSEFHADPSGYSQVCQEKYADLEVLPGWCPVELMYLLDRRAREIPEGQAYLEIGTFCGRSIVAALRDNPQVEAYVIDPLDLTTEKGTIASLWQGAVDQHLPNHKIHLFKGRSEDFCDDLPMPVNLFFYDGNHDSGHTYEALKKYEPFLADRATIIVDDYHIFGGDAQTPALGHSVDIHSPVKTDTDRWIAENKEKIIDVIITPESEAWLNGQAIIEYKDES